MADLAVEFLDMFAALSALNAFSKNLAVVSNNVASMYTNGYKKSKAVLQEGQNSGVEVSIEKVDTPEAPYLIMRSLISTPKRRSI